MRKQPADDWGTPLGADPEKEYTTASPKKTPRQDTLSGLVGYFATILPVDAWGKLNSPVNGKALMVGVKKLRDSGKTPEEIRNMMKTFAEDLVRKPLPNGVAPWRAFLANLDHLSNTTTAPKETTYDDLQVDIRLLPD
jgi:hypothetical protein